MLVLKAASSPRIFDQVYLVPVETASKDNSLKYKLDWHIIQSNKLKVQVFKDIRLVYLSAGVNAGLQMK